jgi:hypothetical protein
MNALTLGVSPLEAEKMRHLYAVLILAALNAAPAAAQLIPFSQEPLAANIVGPQIYPRAERAIFRWRMTAGSKLRVEYGATQSLGLQAEGKSTNPSGSNVVYEASLEGLKLGTAYYYKAVLYREQGNIIKPVAETPVTPFRTPHVRVRAQPVRLDVIRDGDKDYFGNKNKGEAAFSWRMALDPGTPVWPEGALLLGCYPGGGTVTVSGPSGYGGEMPGGTYNPNPPPNEPTLAQSIAGAIVTKLGQPSPPTYQTALCVPDQAAEFMVSSPKRAKVSSGASIDLKEPPVEWLLPDGYPISTASAASQVTTATSGRTAPGGATSRARPPTKAGKTSDVEHNDGNKQGVNENAAGTGTPPSPETMCEASTTRHQFVQLVARVKGSEQDKVNNPTTGGQDITYTQNASERKKLCLNLRERDGTTMFGVRARGERFEFKVWFKVDLIYDRN